ncbi:hypothetical protein R84B8_02568 [Treponema sp. R8-4-B8]
MLKNTFVSVNILILVLFVNSCALIGNSIKDTRIKNMDYPQPDLPTKNSLIIDLTTLQGHAEDYVKVHSFVRDETFEIMIWIHDIKDNIWKEYGLAKLKYFGDTDTVSKSIKISLDDIKYVGIEFINNENYKIIVFKKNNDLQIEVRK